MEDSEIEALLMKANDNRNQLTETIRGKIEEIEQIITDINSDENDYLNSCLKRAKEYDVNYTPDRNVVQEFLNLISKLNTVLEKLQSLSLTEETILEEDKYFTAAEKVTEEVDSIIKGKKQKFTDANQQKFEEACARKRDIEIELSNIEFSLNFLNREREDLEKQNSKLEKGIKGKKKKAQIQANNARIAEIDKEKRDLEARTTSLKLRGEAEHFVPVTTGQEDEKNNESDKDIEIK